MKYAARGRTPPSATWDAIASRVRQPLWRRLRPASADHAFLWCFWIREESCLATGELKWFAPALEFVPCYPYFPKERRARCRWKVPRLTQSQGFSEDWVPKAMWEREPHPRCGSY